MPIADTYVPVKSMGNGTTVSFSFNFPIIAEANLRVYLEDKDTGVQTLVDSADFDSVVFDDDTPGGIVTFTTAPTDQYWVIRAREIPFTQTVEIKTSPGFKGSVIQAMFDKLTALVQDVRERANRAILVPIGSAETPDYASVLLAAASVTQDLVDQATAAQVAAEEAKDAALAAVASVPSLASILSTVLPVGTVISLGVSTNPATLFGFGTWTAIAGKVIVGLNGSETEFNTLNETGGAKTVTLAKGNIPAHVHTVNVFGSGLQSHGDNYLQDQTGNTGDGTADGLKASPDPVSVLQPYIVKYVWERTA